MSVSVGFISLGCSKNLVDSQVMAGYLKAGAIALAPSPEEADVVLINTCAFIESAREEAAGAILRACAHKERGGCRAVVVAGCMVQRYRSRLKAAFPGVDAFLGIDELERIGEVVGNVAKGKRCGVIAARGMPVKCYKPPYPTLLFTGGPFAYLKIAEGCDHRCAYCAIPNIRGAYRSRSEDELVHEAQAMVRAGVREINLISQDTLRYGTDRGGKSAIVPLIRRLDRIRGAFRIRLLYGYPAGVTKELLHVMNTSHHVCWYLDLPIQHSHPEILRAMRRGKAVAATQDLAARLRQTVPGLVLRTTCLVGFPGETETHFEHLMEYVERSAFDHLGVFAFSPEEGTPAAAMGGTPSRKVAEERCARLMRLQRRIVRRRVRDLTGREDTVLLLRRTKTGWVGRLPRQAPDVDGETHVSHVPRQAKVGDFVRVEITGGRGYDLMARAV
ncbi:MAG TPA: 30S ribosomal protein S12 methylthiotransferase RimO [Kiritimatiellia bacterium]|jgi:ribosomal protein S12 methylthiotransferase|nr:30S ribosomal protein S12 methylthiotransferase RimO [Kiritimatiellia bacterium]HRU20352.1 30S ribosomal protein S12 methylthiotransferase RimO [Kiritimatiellia bacterium]